MTEWNILDGSTLKLDRAAVHIKELKAISKAYLADNPYSLSIEKHPEHGHPCIKTVFHRPIPAVASAVAGDCVHNLRSALDHLAADMIRASGNRPTRNSGFPIYKDEAGFEGGAPEKLKGAAERFRDFVLNLKP